MKICRPIKTKNGTASCNTNDCQAAYGFEEKKSILNASGDWCPE